jgi:class 3 adenylate cyclase
MPADMFVQRAIAENVLKAYIGRTPRMLVGQIRRGAGEEITAILWSSDLRSFTQLSDRLPGDRVIAILDAAAFDAQATAIERHGGGILKFIGERLLAVFPIADHEAAEQAAGADGRRPSLRHGQPPRGGGEGTRSAGRRRRSLCPPLPWQSQIAGPPRTARTWRLS